VVYFCRCRAPNSPAKKASTDPVCAMRVDRYATEHQLRFEGKAI